MPQETKEWQMVVELAEMIRNLETEEQQEFIADLYNNLDPHLPFLDQQNEKQEKWLYVLYDYYCEDNQDAFEGFDED